MGLSYFLYDKLSDLVTFSSGEQIFCSPWENFSKKYNPPFDVDNIMNINYEIERGIQAVGLVDNQNTCLGPQSLEINWIKSNWENFCETFHELEVFPVTVLIERIARLSNTDWLVQRHQEQLLLNITTSLTQQQFEELLTYRQSLRDITLSSSLDALASDINWPTVPSYLEEAL
jgi:hypothetical protein